MSTLGRILAIFNFLVAGLVLFLFILTHGQRQKWAYAVYRADLLIEGLPIDSKETEVDGSTPRVEKLTSAKSILNEYFGPLGPVVTTQVDEVRRVEGIVKGRIDNDAIPGTREQKLARVLVPLARTFGERDELTQVAIGARKDASFNMVDRLAEVFAAPSNTQLSLDQRKLSAGRLLMALAEIGDDENAAVDPLATLAHRRAVAVVGLGTAIAALDANSSVLQSMIPSAEQALLDDRSLFVAQHARLLYTIQNMADDLQRQNAFLETKKDERAKQESLAKQTAEKVKRLEGEIVAAGKATGEKLTEQARVETEVFNRLREMRDAARKNQELEAELRKLEGITNGR